MRRLVPLLFLAAAACGKLAPTEAPAAPRSEVVRPDGAKVAESSAPAPEPGGARPEKDKDKDKDKGKAAAPGDRPAAFDPDGAEKTFDWILAGLAEAEKAPAGNDFAYQEGMKKFQADVSAAATGKTIRWRVKLLKVNAEGECCLSVFGRDFPIPPARILRPDERNLRRRYTLIPAAPYKSSGPPIYDDGALAGANFVKKGFPPNPLKADWLASLKAGDELVLTGTVGKVTVNMYSAVFGIDGGRVEKR